MKNLAIGRLDDWTIGRFGEGTGYIQVTLSVVRPEPDPFPVCLFFLLLPGSLKLAEIFENHQNIFVMIGYFLLYLGDLFQDILMSNQHLAHTGKNPYNPDVYKNCPVAVQDAG